MKLQFGKSCYNGFCNQFIDSFKNYYNIFGLQDSSIQKHYSDNILSYTQKTYSTYNSDESVKEKLSVYIKDDLIQTFKSTYTYDSEGNNISVLTQGNINRQVFFNEGLLTISYKNGLLIYDVYQQWNSQTNTWENIYRDSIEQEAPGRPSTQINQNYDKNSNTWVNTMKFVIYYSNCKTLPLTLLTFTGKKTSNGNLLEWKTTNEVNFSHFVIQRSKDATNFTDINELKVKGNIAGINNYSFLDKNIRDQNKLYYRLKMVDKDGSSKLSGICLIQKENNDFSIYPNPTTSYINIQSNKRGVIEIYNSKGTLAYSGKINGNTKVTTGQFSKGLYMIKIRDDAGNIQLNKVIVQ